MTTYTVEQWTEAGNSYPPNRTDIGSESDREYVLYDGTEILKEGWNLPAYALVPPRVGWFTHTYRWLRRWLVPVLGGAAGGFLYDTVRQYF